ncbi:hypothetical protein G6F22_018861 [Rhizopus arrhizus]|nr:hypothetical protein G6F22_018861 [Rhizopus arrhizus]
MKAGSSAGSPGCRRFRLIAGTSATASRRGATRDRTRGRAQARLASVSVPALVRVLPLASAKPALQRLFRPEEVVGMIDVLDASRVVGRQRVHRASLAGLANERHRAGLPAQA